MKLMDSAQIRKTFLEFFESKGHKIVPSAPLPIKNDPSLMFINAGMNPFKDLFLGQGKAKHPRVADTQKCLRVSGKHNDLEEVGLDTYHHTFFEMLGNWSFGDYFKKEAIDWAWELLTGPYGMDPKDMYATYFGGAAEDSLDADKEAQELWHQYLPADHVLSGSKKDNFWEMGETGPCGPCSEIHIDLRPEKEKRSQPGRDLVNTGHPQVIEIWNLVFMQFNRSKDGKLQALPNQHVDTGMGFERLCMVLQGKTSSYDTDVFSGIIKKLELLSGKKYGKQESVDVAMRVAADHIRAVAFTIADGTLPDNARAGYVIRRILRRAVRYGYSGLGLSDPFMHELVPVLADQFKTVFPELHRQKESVARIIEEEEKAFLRTLESGLKRIEGIRAQLKGKMIPGAQVFELLDTFGFPVDLTALLAREHGLELDMEGFEQCLQEQKERSRKAAKVDRGDWVVLNKGEGEFVGYDALDCTTTILQYRPLETNKGKQFQVELASCPFYPQGGGQVGDQGWLVAGEEKIPVLDTVKENRLILCTVPRLPKDLSVPVQALVNADLRLRTQHNHSATHLLHVALRKHLGTHVHQKGSLVHPDYLRFDFSHFAALGAEELHAIEDEVNRGIRDNWPCTENRNESYKKAIERGAMALFGEKYGDEVRTIEFGPEKAVSEGKAAPTKSPYSLELCGGTHVQRTGDIGFFKIVAETGVASGVRRIEALTGEAAVDYVRQIESTLEQVKQSLKSPDPLKQIQQLQDQVKTLEKKLKALEKSSLDNLKQELEGGAQHQNGARVILAQLPLEEANQVKDLAFQLSQAKEPLFFVGLNQSNDKAFITIMIDPDLAKEKKLNAGELVREWAPLIKGGGGGQAHFATAGGKDPSGLELVLEKARELAQKTF